jgi:NTE family protein
MRLAAGTTDRDAAAITCHANFWFGVLILLVLASSACAPLNAVDKPLSRWTPELDRRTREQIVGDRSPELLVLVAFSGGGTRAAAFAYGVLQELAHTEVTTKTGSRPLLHEVDAISSVSGGSFTSAYYALRGERIFEEFEARFLRKNVEGALFWRLFNPINWFRLGSRTYGRADLAADYYDKQLFHGATFSDLQRSGAPFVVINSTDLATGIRFSFTQGSFDFICADLGQYPVSRAVTASSAVPILFSPITLKSFAGSCGYEPPAWMGEALKQEGGTVRKAKARVFEEYLDREQRPWLHLVDGGIADNLGLRAFYDTLSVAGDPGSHVRELAQHDVRQILILSVNSHARPKTHWILERYAPSLLQMVHSVSADQISRYSVDTVALVRSSFEQRTKQLSTPQRPVTFDFVDVSFDEVRDDAERDFLNNIGTNFHLDAEQVDRLIAAARKVLRESVEFQAFLGRRQSRGDGPQEPRAQIPPPRRPR